MIAELLHGAANVLGAAARAYDEQRTGFSEREAGDYLDAAAEFMDLDELDLPRSDEPQRETPPADAPGVLAELRDAARTIAATVEARLEAAVSQETLAESLTGLWAGFALTSRQANQIARELLTSFHITAK
ncbi:hypothetical protein SEA_PHILONIUS_39 [Mycobacterium phage Philonius]|uniref:Uncharacterized protein n=2 Tax=Charlievirus TaxID=1623280 RepID=A0A2H4PD04_9CAUD|nr:hypothetical protein CH20_gp39 [Mycobacterium phage MichelleMyBell]YP_010051903.1 hypothetical protein KD928_gp39 [Mycobacterium phage Philonius]AHG24360.1 hypothetical protein PBI_MICHELLEMYBELL_39 [Mycobacterium phage MichelleMyBell]ATW60098.1 hypothetical protein SEA_PHILONIUS_39 [Mycobacterium phage Philonius]